ncbi:phage protein NinX family protein [Paraburkholderia sediminicola]|uniref:phage protein NinX family protein n=1 Tax=Paraburkholderia sediminicola TaxID=458836 RepID=UPI0038BA8421
MRVSELSGDLLDYWVARAEGIEHGPDLREMRPGGVLIKMWSKEGFTFYTAYTPSTDIAQAWPIIERERPSLTPLNSGVGWYATHNGMPYYGDTVQVAALRAFVGATFGESVPVEVPA